MIEAITSIALFGASFLGVGLFRKWVARKELLDHPNERSSHTVPTPTGAGLVIVLLVLGCLITFGVAFSQLRSVFYIAIGAALISFVSWLDDLKPLPSAVRFGVHGVAAVIAIWGFGHFQSMLLPGVGFVTFGSLGIPITFIWIVGLTNAYNFMDGIDGIAGIEAIVAGSGWAVVGWLVDQPIVTFTGIFLASASCGFLIHNWQPAKIFMGDVGSAFLGYLFAILSLVLLDSTPSQDNAFLIGILVVWPFVFDTLLTFFRRLYRRENVFAAHRSHLYQRLVIAGNSHQKITIIYGLLGLAGPLLAICLLQKWDHKMMWFSILPMMAVALWIFTIKQDRVKRYNVQEAEI